MRTNRGERLAARTCARSGHSATGLVGLICLVVALRWASSYIAAFAELNE